MSAVVSSWHATLAQLLGALLLLFSVSLFDNRQPASPPEEALQFGNATAVRRAAAPQPPSSRLCG